MRKKQLKKQPGHVPAQIELVPAPIPAQNAKGIERRETILVGGKKIGEANFYTAGYGLPVMVSLTLGDGLGETAYGHGNDVPHAIDEALAYGVAMRDHIDAGLVCIRVLLGVAHAAKPAVPSAAILPQAAPVGAA